MRFAANLLAGILAVAFFAACGDSNGGSDPTLDGNGQTPEPTATSEEAASFPDTPVVATLTETYKVGADGSSSVPSDDELPVASGSVEARWYQSEGRYVVHYAGLSLAESGPICPGNSISTANGFEYISNAPSDASACTGVDGLAAAPAGVKLCGDAVLYLTEIPVDVEGTLFGTIEIYPGDGSIIGLTSMAPADSAAAPEIDLSSCQSAAG